MSITKPMLAATAESVDDIKLPTYATPKLDGIRCLKLNNSALSRSFKAIPNAYIQERIASITDGPDGELMVRGTEFNGVQSGVMSGTGEPDFVYHVFDFVKDSVKKPYLDRMKDLEELELPDFCVKVFPVLISTREELIAFNEKCLAEGYEGAMFRSASSPYKCGRSTLKEAYLVKLKPFKDSEAVITGFEEKMHNENEATKDAFGRTKRSSHKDNMVPAGTLGIILATDIHTGDKIRVGTFKGLKDKDKQHIWDNQSQYMGKMFNYRYQEIGMKDLPRIPAFRGWRDSRDM